MISSEIIEEIKYRCSIEDVVSEYVQLKRAGSNLNGHCPFHSERTPSFTIFPATKSFYCFGCGAGGDVITFIMKRENLDYRSALELLAARAGIELPREEKNDEPERGVKRERVLSMNRDAAKYFHSTLYSPQGTSALNYLSNRGLSGAIIKHFGLGFAPEGFGGLTDYLMKLGYTAEEMSAGFLCGISKKSGRPYDYFRNRVIFPIIDVTGNVVAFGGRVMDGSEPKYLNTSDTPAFKKSRNLFALNYARSKCSEKLILCEGYMDVIALHAHGFENAVATLGTAITPEQARIMAKYTNQVIISYDSDSAGQKAASKALKLLDEVGLDARVITLKGAKDPDEFMKKNGADGPSKFKLILDGSKSPFEFKFDGVLSRYDISLMDEKIKAADELCRIIAAVPSESEREIYIGFVSDKLSLLRDSLRNDVKMAMRAKTRASKKEEIKGIINKTAGYGDRINPDTMKNIGAVSLEENILGILLLYPEYFALIKRGKLSLSGEDFFSEFNRRVFEEACRRSTDTGGLDISLLNEVFNVDEMGRITSMTVRRRQLTENGEGLLRELAGRLKDQSQRRENAENEMAQIADIIANQRGKLKK